LRRQKDWQVMEFLGFMFKLQGCGISDGDISEQTIGMGSEDAKVGLEIFYVD